MNEQEKPMNSDENLKESLKALHHAKPSENISILDTSTQRREELIEKIHETLSFGKVKSVSELESNESNQVKYNSQEKMAPVNKSKFTF